MKARSLIGWGLAAVGLLALSRAAVRYLWPVPGGELSSPFGPRTHPITGEVKQHNGIDIAAPVGSPVLAVDDGLVSQVYRHTAGGLTVVLSLDDGNRAAFAHLSRTDVEPGDRVQRGDRIAYVGASGIVTGPHLHFSIQRGGKFVDPLDYLG